MADGSLVEDLARLDRRLRWFVNGFVVCLLLMVLFMVALVLRLPRELGVPHWQLVSNVFKWIFNFLCSFTSVLAFAQEVGIWTKLQSASEEELSAVEDGGLGKRIRKIARRELARRARASA